MWCRHDGVLSGGIVTCKGGVVMSGGIVSWCRSRRARKRRWVIGMEISFLQIASALRIVVLEGRRGEGREGKGRGLCYVT